MAPSSTKKKNPTSSRATDYGSPELAKRFTVVPKLTASNSFTGKVCDDTEIDLMLLHDKITALEHSLLVALLNRLHRATFVGLKSPDLNSVSASDPSRMADRKAVAVMGVCRIIEAMDVVMGQGRRKALVDLVLLDKPWPDLPGFHDCVLALQDILGDGERKFKRKQAGQNEVLVGVHAHS